MALIISRLQTINNNYNNIDWNDISISNTLVYDSLVTSISGLSNISKGLYNTIYYYFDIPVSATLSKYFMFSCNVMTSKFNLDYNITFYILDRRSSTWIQIPSYTFDFFNSYYANTTFVSYLDYRYDYIDINNLSHMMVSIQPISDSLYLYNTNFSCKYIDYNNIDFYTLNTYDILKRFKSLYASDDFIESKEAQQPLEDQIISDFTGNGSASATVGDAVNVKQASNAIKNGLNTGANSGVALDYAFDFNNPSGLFVWFSSDTAQYFTLYQPTRGFSDYNSIEWTDELPDHLSILDYKYLQGLGND